MYLLLTITKGKPVNYVAKSCKVLQPFMEAATEWRMNDGNGWCASKSEDSCKKFQSAAGEKFIYVI